MDAVAVLMDCTQQAWTGKKVAGALLVDVKSRRLRELDIEPDLVRWTDSFMSDWKVKLVLEGRVGEEHEVETGSHRDLQLHRYCSRPTCLGSLTTWTARAQGFKDSRSWTTWHGGRRESRRKKWQER